MFEGNSIFVLYIYGRDGKVERIKKLSKRELRF
jgi:hypothetical protein